ncbi:alpha/beta fold hydrolase [Hymenobacter yonginensis]|uniref:Alpha/beta hydrolase n=1 Tax=Hymenobacter yonginensis TaxID=748197 RepID=A0ABY7PP30_9BACT|nr:alpha/beta hydrolase [Hymenobacter yonginensis]WBO85025.1 alpha/beta hydrolase [Hymenobacter yonginensis]
MDILKRNNVRVFGHGPRTLLLVNGYGCDQSIWGSVAPTLAKQFRVVLFDQMGAGDADFAAYEPDKYASLAGYTQDLLDICRHLKLTQVTLIGHSVGAMICMLAAIEEPGLFRQLLLLCPSPCYTNHPDYHGGFEQTDIDSMLAYMETDFVGWADSFAHFVMGTPDRPSLVMELSHRFCKNDQLIAKQFARVTFTSDNRHDLERVTTPCLLVQCAQDLVAPLEVGAYLLAAIPQATLVTLPISGHCPHVSAPLETLTVLQSFMAA